MVVVSIASILHYGYISFGTRYIHPHRYWYPTPLCLPDGGPLKQEKTTLAQSPDHTNYFAANLYIFLKRVYGSHCDVV
jgi:hypothetical protein